MITDRASEDECLASAPDSRPPRRQEKSRGLYLFGTVFAIASALALIELRWPYFFLQDDNRDFSLPLLVYNFRSILSGELPLYNFHQFSGEPCLSHGLSNTLYAPAYIAGLLSRAFLGNYYGTIDFLVVLHLLIGGVGTFVLLHRLTGDHRVAFWGATTFELSSFVVYISCNWASFSVPPAYFPWALYFVLKLLDGARYRDILGLILARLGLVYYGYPELAVWAGIYEALILCGLFAAGFGSRDRRTRRHTMCWLAATWVFTALLSAPLILPMWRETGASAFRGAPLTIRAAGGGYPLSHWLLGLLYPFSTYYDTTSVHNGLTRALPYMSHISYPAVVFIGIALYLLAQGRMGERGRRVFALLSVLTLISFLVTLGGYVGLLHYVPLLNRFRWPFRYNVFTTLFLVTLAAFGFAALLGLIRQERARAVFTVCAALTFMNFMALYIGTRPKLFRAHQESIPLKEPLQDRLSNGKLMSVGYRWDDEHSASSGGFAYANLWELYQIAGYDTLVGAENLRAGLDLNFWASFTDPPDELPIKRLRRWGTRWYIVARYAPEYGRILLQNGLRVAYDDSDRIVYEDPAAPPLVGWTDAADNATVRARIGVNSITADTTRTSSGSLTARFVFHPRFVATVDGNPAAIRRTADGQFAVNVPAGRHTVVLRYTDPEFTAGCVIAGVTLLAVAITLGAVRGRWGSSGTYVEGGG